MRWRRGLEPGVGAAQGQIMVVFALALMLAIIPMVALVIEGGNLFAQQRIAQNGSTSRHGRDGSRRGRSRRQDTV